MDSYDKLRFIVHILFILLIVLGSLLIFLVIYITKQYKTPSGLLIGNLALTDLLVGGFLLPFGIPAIIFEGWSIGRGLCVLNGFTNQCLSSVAILTLAAISLDRYVAIIHAIRYYQIMTLRRVRLIIVILWMFGVISGTFPMLGWGQYIYQHGASLCVTDFKTDKSFTFFILVAVFGIPLNVIFFIYFRIFMAVRKHAKAIRSNAIHPTNQKEHELRNENEVQLTNQRTSRLTNENEVQLTNQRKSRLTNENEVQLTNQRATQLTNENEVQQTNQLDDQLTNDNPVHSTNHGENQLTNENAAKLSNQTAGQLANENTVHSTNQSGLELTNDTTAVHPPTMDGSTNQHESFSTNHEAPCKASSTNHSKAYTADQNKEPKPTLPKTKSFHIKLKKESKAALTTLAIVGVFVLALTPFTVYNLYSLMTGESYEIADFITSKVAYSNAIFNPLVYGVMNKVFRKGFYQVFYLVFRRKKRLGHSFSVKSSFTK